MSIFEGKFFGRKKDTPKVEVPRAPVSTDDASSHNRVKQELDSLRSKWKDVRSRLHLPSLEEIRVNPYRASFLGNKNSIHDDAYEILNEANLLLQRAKEVSEEEVENVQNFRKEVIAAISGESGILKSAGEMTEAIEMEIRRSKIDNEILGADTAINQESILGINRQSEEIPPENSWDPERVGAMSTDELIDYMNTNGSGRYFKHSFPPISLAKGALCTGIGGEAQLGGFHTVRDGKGGIDIDFTPDLSGEQRAEEGFYGTISEGGGGDVVFPAEVILENYAFLNLPYHGKETVTSEWRLFGPPKDPNNKLHILPLRLGICFISEEHRRETEEYLALLPESQRPNKIIYYSDEEEQGEHSALRQYLLSRLKQPEGLPKLSRPIRKIGEINELTTVFGTDKAMEHWNGAKS